MKVTTVNVVNLPQKYCAPTQDDIHADDFLLNGLFVDVCLDFSIAQYMED